MEAVVKDEAQEDEVYSSVDDMVNDGATDVKYAVIEGFKEGGKKVCIGSVSAGDMIEWSEANEGEAKRTAGLRLISKSLVDGIPGKHKGATGRRISTDKDIAKFRTMRHEVTERIVKDVLKLNGINLKADNAAKND